MLRLLFILWGADFYFNRANIFVDGDTAAWFNSIYNLIENGTYTCAPENEYGYFGRIPGYSFFIGFFYLLSGKNMDILYPLIGWVQTAIDVYAIYLVYRICKISFQDQRIAIISSILYASYPFIIVWTPVAYSEMLGVFFMIVSLYFLVREDLKFRWVFVGIAISLAILMRPQLALLVPLFYLVLIFTHKNNVRQLLKFGIQFTLMVVIVYGSWPIRNYVNYNKIIPTQDIRGLGMQGEDFTAFMQYIYSVKSGWEPQWHEILENRDFTYPEQAIKFEGDSVKLARAVHLSKNCGKSFSKWKGYWKNGITGEDCSDEISKLFTELRENQIQNNPLNFYLLVPLQNLKKTIFKAKLAKREGLASLVGSLLFSYRTLLLFLGFAGAFLICKHNATPNYLGWIAISFFAIWYITLCFGTSVQFRNIEMRYLLPTDVILLIPASYAINEIMMKFGIIERKVIKS